MPNIEKETVPPRRVRNSLKVIADINGINRAMIVWAKAVWDAAMRRATSRSQLRMVLSTGGARDAPWPALASAWSYASLLRGKRRATGQWHLA